MRWGVAWKKSGIVGTQANLFQIVITSHSAHLLPGEKNADENVFVSLLCLCVFSLNLARGSVVFLFLFDSFLWFGTKRGWVGGGFETSEGETQSMCCFCFLFFFFFSLLHLCVAVFPYYLMNALRGSSAESRDSFMTTAGQLYVNRDTDAVG